MNIFSTIAMMMAGIAFFAAVYQLSVYMHSRQQRENLTFSLLSCAVCIYDLFCAGLYSAPSVEVGSVWQRLQVIALAFITAFFLWFVYDYTRQLSQRVVIVLTIFFAFAAMAGIFIHNEWIWILSQPSVKSFNFLGGFRVTYYEVSPGWLITLQTLVGFLSTGYIIWGAVRFYRAQPGRKAFLLVLALAIFTLAAINDSAVSMGFYQNIYIIEYAYLGIILLMIYSLSSEVFEVTFLQRRLRASEQQFYNILEASPMGIHLYQMEADGRLIFKLANPAAESILDVNHQQFIGKPMEEIFPLSLNGELLERLRGVCLDGKPWTTEIAFSLQQDPTARRTFEIYSFRTTPGMIALMFLDVSERKAAETALRERQRAIEKLTMELEQRVADRTAELQLKNRELETFTYSVSHDLKAPLRAIDGYSRILQESYEGGFDEDGRKCLKSIHSSVDRMNRLIDDLLAYSRLERREMVKDSVALNEVVDSIIAERLNEIETRHIQLLVSIPPLQLNTEEEGLFQALRNLFDNALKFTREVPQPSIEIGAQAKETTVLMWVKDNGIGFDMQHRERIFEIFQRLHRVEDYPGTGIGLAIVSKVMQRLGGRAWAESSPQEKTIFYLELPL